MPLFRELRRKRLRSRPFPPAWLAIMERHVPLYGRLSAEDREELRGHVLVFLAEKRFEGCGGLTVSDEMRVTIAAQACLLLLHRRSGYYPGVSSILVYPGEYRAPHREVDEAGIVTEGIDLRSGESWPGGSLVLSWEDVLAGAGAFDGYNVVLHEFAHQLDAEDGITDGTPPLPERNRCLQWRRTLESEYQRLKREAAHGRETLLDPYGAESPAEFFAVATECFFEQPREMRERHPELYRELARYYRQDPAESW